MVGCDPRQALLAALIAAALMPCNSDGNLQRLAGEYCSRGSERIGSSAFVCSSRQLTSRTQLRMPIKTASQCLCQSLKQHMPLRPKLQNKASNFFGQHIAKTHAQLFNQKHQSQLAHRSASARWTCVSAFFNGEGGEGPEGWEEDEMSDEEPERLVLLRDTKADRVIECFVDREMEINGKTYVTLMPADMPVIFAGFETINGTEQLVPVLEEERIDSLFPSASAVLAELDFSLSRSAVVLTVEGTSDDYDSDEDGSGYDDEEEKGQEILYIRTVKEEPKLGLRRDQLVEAGAPERDVLEAWAEENGFDASDSDDDSDSDEEEEGEDGESKERVEVLAVFYHEGKKHVVAAPVGPVVIIGSPVGEPAIVVPGAVLPAASTSTADIAIDSGDLQSYEQEYVLPDTEELARVTPIIKQCLEVIFDKFQENEERLHLADFRSRLLKQWKPS